MNISTRGRYAVKLMLDLAFYNNGMPIKLKDIAKRQDISEKYLEQIIAPLTRASLVKSTRGATGGYKLAKAPEDYTIGSILRVVEGNLSPVDCDGINDGDCDHADYCVTMRIWQQLDEAVNGVLDNIRLSDLVEWQNELVNQYVI